MSGRHAVPSGWEVAMLVTDAQIHLWEVDRPDRPWPKDGRTTPHRPNGFRARQGTTSGLGSLSLVRPGSRV